MRRSGRAGPAARREERIACPQYKPRGGMPPGPPVPCGAGRRPAPGRGQRPTPLTGHGGEATLAAMDAFVSELREKGLLDLETSRRLDELETRKHVPLARELHALLYLGAVLILAGVGAAVQGHLDALGPMAILTALGFVSAACV